MGKSRNDNKRVKATVHNSAKEKVDGKHHSKGEGKKSQKITRVARNLGKNEATSIKNTSIKKGSNWEMLKNKLNDPSNGGGGKKSAKRGRSELTEAALVQKETKKAKKEEEKKREKLADLPEEEKQNYLAIDCEMVGTGPSGKRSALARCCVISFDGEVLYDEYVKPPERITDFRTKYSGVRAKDLKNAISLQKCQNQVAALLKGKVLVGHALKNDLDALLLSHNPSMIRDTARFRPYMKAHGKQGGKMRPRSLASLSKEYLGEEIQIGEHDPAEDARAAMMLYRLKRKMWEKSIHTSKISRKKATSVNQFS